MRKCGHSFRSAKFHSCLFHFASALYYFGEILKRNQVYHSPCGATFRWLGKDRP